MVLYMNYVTNPDLCYTIHDTFSWNNHVSDLGDRIRSNVAFAITMSIDNIFFKQR